MPPAEATTGTLPARFDFDGIGTRWRIDTPEPLSVSLRTALLARVERFDRDWSRFRADSLVTRIATQPGRHRLPDEAAPLLRFYDQLHRVTRGRVNPLVGSSLERLGYGGSLGIPATGRAEPAPDWHEQVTRDGEWITTTTPVVIDVGAAGKGLLVDLLGSLLDDAGIDEHVVDGSGDLAHRGAGRLRVALEHPLDPELAVGTIELRDAALAASATNRRRWGAGLHHIIDATTGRPVDEIMATWVICDQAMIADGLATALFTTEPEQLTGFDCQWVRMRASGRLECSDGFEGALFT